MTVEYRGIKYLVVDVLPNGCLLQAPDGGLVELHCDVSFGEYLADEVALDRECRLPRDWAGPGEIERSYCELVIEFQD